MLLLLVGLAGLVMAVSVGLLRGEDQARTNRADVDHSAYLRDAAARLARWYEVNSATTGAQAGQIDMAQALAGAGVTQRYNLQSASSVRLSDGLVSWHVMALWLPEPIRVQGTAFDAATGVLTPGTLISTGQPADLVSAIVNGHASQLVAFTERAAVGCAGWRPVWRTCSPPGEAWIHSVLPAATGFGLSIAARSRPASCLATTFIPTWQRRQRRPRPASRRL